MTQVLIRFLGVIIYGDASEVILTLTQSVLVRRHRQNRSGFVASAAPALFEVNQLISAGLLSREPPSRVTQRAPFWSLPFPGVDAINAFAKVPVPTPLI